MTAEHAFVGVPLGNDAPSPQPTRGNKACQCLLPLLVVAAALVWCLGTICITHLALFSPIVAVKVPDDDDDAYDYIRLYDYREDENEAYLDEVDKDDLYTPNDVTIGSSVAILTADTVNMFLQENPAAFVVFDTPWCAWSQRLAPTWKMFASKVADWPVAIGKMDCQEYADVCREQNIMAYPTIRWFHDGTSISPDYKMDRTVAALTGFTKHKLIQAGMLLVDDDVEDDVASLSAAEASHEGYVKGRMNAEEAAVLEGRHQGFRRHASSNDRMTRLSHDDAPTFRRVESKYYSDDEYRVDEMVFAGNHAVILSDDNFHAFLEEHDTVFVDFYAPWCIWSAKLAPVWDEFALQMQTEDIEIAKVDCVANPNTCQNQGIIAFPTLRLYQKGKAQGPGCKEDRTVAALTDYVKRQVYREDSVEEEEKEYIEPRLEEEDDELSNEEEEYEEPLFKDKQIVDASKEEKTDLIERFHVGAGLIEDDDIMNDEESSLLPRWVTTLW